MSDGERTERQARVRGRKTARGDAVRAEIVLRAAEGMTDLAIAERLGVTRVTVASWRKRFAARRLEGLLDEPRSGAPRKIGDETIAEVVTTTLETMPRAATHWSTRSMARASGLSVSTVHRIWRAVSLQPHRSETFKLSSDPLFVEKVRDIVGLNLNPPERALVLCVDKKSQIQALDRTQPLLPLRPGQAERRTHDYKRHGTTSRFAALDVKGGTIIGTCMPRHRAEEFRRFLDTVENNLPADLDVHVIMDNASSHKTALIRDWFARRPAWHAHSTPTSSSWINQVERFFGLLTEHKIRRGAHRSTKDLEAAITDYIARATPTPSRSDGPRAPTTSSHPLPASAAAPSPSKPNVHRNFRIGTIVQIDHQGGDRLPERRTGFQPGRGDRGPPLAAAGAPAAEQPHPRHLRPDRRQLDAVIYKLRRLLAGGEGGGAMRAGVERGIDDAIRVRLQRAGDTGTALARRPVARGTIALLALRGRQRGIVRRLGRTLKFTQPLLKVSNPRQRRLKLPDQRQQRQDERILLRVAQRAEVDFRRHSQVESSRP